MKRSARFDKIVALNKGFKAIAGKGLARARARLEADEKKLEQLIGYLRDYQRNFNARIQQSISCSELVDYRAFLAYLEKAIRQQSARVEQSQREMEGARDAWLSKKHEVKKITAAADTMKQRENAEADRREMKDSDERNQWAVKAEGIFLREP